MICDESWKIHDASLITEINIIILLSKGSEAYLQEKSLIVNELSIVATLYDTSLLKIESEPINAYFKNNSAMHRDYLKVTKEHVETLQELLEQARALKL
ncbi:hypothetical protein Tco_0178594 [Tanacetum coccineum]